METGSTTLVILLKVSFSELKVNIKEDITSSPVTDISQKTEGGEMKLTHKQAGLSACHDGGEDAGALVWPRAPSQETEDGGARSRTNT